MTENMEKKILVMKAKGWIWNKGGTLNHTLFLLDYV